MLQPPDPFSTAVFLFFCSFLYSVQGAIVTLFSPDFLSVPLLLTSQVAGRSPLLSCPALPPSYILPCDSRPSVRPSCGFLRLQSPRIVSVFVVNRCWLLDFLDLSWRCFAAVFRSVFAAACIVRRVSDRLVAFLLPSPSSTQRMWLYRGVQSAVFYYASCTPCANSIDRRKRLKDAVRSKREREKNSALVTDQPRPFAQPIPFSTNPGWNEEIALGPGPPARNHRALNRRTDSWNTDGLSNSSLDADVEGPSSSQKKEKSSSRHNHPLGDRLHRMRYQREDEPLWGEEVKDKAGRGRSESKYYIARVPPVNDLHPPIVSGPKSRTETRWMLQPPPSARVMAGKERSRASVRCSPPGSSALDEDNSEHLASVPTTLLPYRKQQQSQPTSSSAPKKHPKPSPIAIHPDYHAHRSSDPERSTLNTRRPSSTLHAHGRDESNFVIASLYSPSEPPSPLSSPADSEVGSSWRCPETPVSRPASKATDGSGKVYRPAVSKALSTLHREHHGDSHNNAGDNKVHMLQLEINDQPEDAGMGQFEPAQPYRWSMDI